MAGIYLHIPFCKQACNYCDFHFSTSLKHKTALIRALMKEIELRKEELSGESISSIYLGGGTPSLLDLSERTALFETLYRHYPVEKDAEITLEANPDDLTPTYLKQLKASPINRLSIGVQSFLDEDLSFMKRAHNAKEAFQSIVQSQDAGFENISLDLIYGLPQLTLKRWEENLKKVASLKIQHLSAYALTVEKRTTLYHDIQTGKSKMPDDEMMVDHFTFLSAWAKKESFVHYEISNLCKEGFVSRHNSSYWQQKKYLGFGPAAHSYSGNERQWNIRSNIRYIKALEKDQLLFEKETLSMNDRFNEYIMTSLRTIWGTSTTYIEHQFGTDYLEQVQSIVRKLLYSGEIILTDNRITLSEKGKLVADKVAAQLFVTA